MRITTSLDVPNECSIASPSHTLSFIDNELVAQAWGMPARERVMSSAGLGGGNVFASPRWGSVGRYPTQGASCHKLPHTQGQIWVLVPAQGQI